MADMVLPHWSTWSQTLWCGEGHKQLDLGDLKGLFQPKLFYDSAKSPVLVVLVALVSLNTRTDSGDWSVRRISVTYSVSVTWAHAVTSNDWCHSEESV